MKINLFAPKAAADDQKGPKEAQPLFIAVTRRERSGPKPE